MSSVSSISNQNIERRSTSLLKTSLGFLGLAVFLLIFADLEITTHDPWIELTRMLTGVITPNFTETENLINAIINTIAFAILGVSLACSFGFGLALIFQYRFVRISCAFVRAIHELFWALLFIQMFGLTPLTGIFAIVIPYSGIFAKVFSEILEESDPTPLKAISAETSKLSTFFFARLPDSLIHFKSYALYRFECGLRSSAILGFIGLPTIGFHLESAFAQAKYSEVAALLIIFYLVITTMHQWMRRSLLPFYIIVSLFILPWGMGDISLDNIMRFFTKDIIPLPLRGVEQFDSNVLVNFTSWFWMMISTQAWPGLLNTVVLTQIALVATGILTLVCFPLISPKFFNRIGRSIGYLFLVILRSTPEYVLAVVFLLLWGPSMLPAILALALHNGAIIGHLIGRYTESLKLRPDSPVKFNLYVFEIIPRVYPQFLAFLFYRWEVIMRETAILGILGITTLGFYIDSAFADLRIDRALFLILVTAMLNIGVDILSCYIRKHLRLSIKAETI